VTTPPELLPPMVTVPVLLVLLAVPALLPAMHVQLNSLWRWQVVPPGQDLPGQAASAHVP
jgi:hypothetical protein